MTGTILYSWCPRCGKQVRRRPFDKHTTVNKVLDGHRHGRENKYGSREYLNELAIVMTGKPCHVCYEKEEKANAAPL